MKREERVYTAPNDPQNYKAKYCADLEGEELSENARIWRVYNDEAREYDRDMVQNWRETIDIFLVLAGLFSAVVTTFVSQTATTLGPDYNKVSAILLAELVNERRAERGSANITLDSPSAINSLLSNEFVPSPIDHWTCGLWFTSLALSLIISLACVVVKQWLSSYLSPASEIPRVAAMTRQRRLVGLRRWNIPLIVAILPQGLVISIFLFLAGLATYLRPLSRPISITVATITATFFILYLALAAISAAVPTCPYRTPLTSAFRFGWKYFIEIPQRIARRLPWWFAYRLRILLFIEKFTPTITDIDITLVEIYQARQHEAQLGIQSLFWLHGMTQNPVVADLIVESLSAVKSVPEVGFRSELQVAWGEQFDKALTQMMPTKSLVWLIEIYRVLSSCPKSVEEMDRGTAHRFVRTTWILSSKVPERLLSDTKQKLMYKLGMVDGVGVTAVADVTVLDDEERKPLRQDSGPYRSLTSSSSSSGDADQRNVRAPNWIHGEQSARGLEWDVEKGPVDEPTYERDKDAS